MKSKLTKTYRQQATELRKIVYSWKLLDNVPLDEYDSVVHLIISQLDNGADKFKLKKVISFELCNNYGFSIEYLEIEKWVSEVLGWWNRKESNL